MLEDARRVYGFRAAPPRAGIAVLKVMYDAEYSRWILDKANESDENDWLEARSTLVLLLKLLPTERVSVLG